MSNFVSMKFIIKTKIQQQINSHNTFKCTKHISIRL